MRAPLAHLRNVVHNVATRCLVADDRPTRILGGSAKGLLVPPSIAKRHLQMVLGTYESDCQRLIVEQCRECHVAYDLGAHVGFLTVLLARLLAPEGRVQAFEPSETEASLVEEFVRVNGMENFVQVNRMAVCDEIGHLSFGAGSFTGILGKAVENTKTPENKSVLVEATTLDHFIYDQGNTPPDFMKVDVESAEPLVLGGAKRLLSEHPPKILVELHGPRACKETLQRLLEHRYRVWWLNGRSNRVSVTSADQLEKHFYKGRWTQHVLALPGSHAEHPANREKHS